MPNQQIDLLSFSDNNATVDNLKTVSGDGVLYFASHGGILGDGTDLNPRTFVLATSTAANALTEALYKSELAEDPFHINPPELIRFNVRINGNGPWVSRYGITAAFISKHWNNFSNNSLVYISACNSDDPRPSTDLPSKVTPKSAQDFKQAVLTKNDSVYAGWTADTTVSNVVATDLLMFDRLLGANQWDTFSLPYFGFNSGQFLKETLPDANGNTFYQRPFDWQTVIQSDVQKHSIQYLADDGKTVLSSPLGKDASSGSVLKFTPNREMSSVFGLLAPSVAFVQIYESGLTNPVLGQPQLQIFGIFGNAEGSVTVGGQGASIPPDGTGWSPTEIVANFPSSGASGSDITVSVQGHPSNAARLTEWLGRFTLKDRWTGNGQSGSAGSLTETVTLNSDFRADFREWREQIHQPPVAPLQAIQNVVKSTTASYVCGGGGSYVASPGPPPDVVTYGWTGAGSLTSWNTTVPLSLPAQFFYISGSVGIPQNTPMQLQFVFSGGSQACSAAISGSSGLFYFDIGAIPPVSTGVTLNADPESAVIAGGNLSLSNCPGPRPPVGNSPCSFQWNTISPVPGSAPDPKSAR